MHIQPRHAIIADLHPRQEMERPRVSRTEDDVVDVLDRRAVFEVDGAGTVAAFDVRDGWVAGDVWVAEGPVAEVGVVAAADDGVEGRCGHAGEGGGYVGAGDGGAYYDHVLRRGWSVSFGFL